MLMSAALLPRHAVVGLLTLAAVPCLSTSGLSEQLLWSAEERRIVVALELDSAVVRAIVPEGWAPRPAPDGVYAGANLFLILADQRRVDEIEPEVARNVLALVWAVPARHEEPGFDGREGFVVVGGFITPQAAPGTYGVYLPADLQVSRALDGQEQDQLVEAWEIAGPEDLGFQFSITYDSDPPEREQAQARTFSGRDPNISMLYRYDQDFVVIYSPEFGIDRVANLVIEPGGGQLGQLLDGSEQLVAVVVLPRVLVEAYLP